MNFLKIISMAIAVAIIVEPFKIRKNKRKRQNSYWFRHFEAENNELPKHINWKEINTFLEITEYGINMPDYHWFMQDWAIQPSVKKGLDKGVLSKKSLRVLQALSKDMEHIYDKVVYYYDHGPNEEDTRSKYKGMEELLNTKYCELSEEMRQMIKEQFILTYEKRRGK